MDGRRTATQFGSWPDSSCSEKTYLSWLVRRVRLPTLQDVRSPCERTLSSNARARLTISDGGNRIAHHRVIGTHPLLVFNFVVNPRLGSSLCWVHQRRGCDARCESVCRRANIAHSFPPYYRSNSFERRRVMTGLCLTCMNPRILIVPAHRAHKTLASSSRFSLAASLDMYFGQPSWGSGKILYPERYVSIMRNRLGSR